MLQIVVAQSVNLSIYAHPTFPFQHTPLLAQLRGTQDIVRGVYPRAPPAFPVSRAAVSLSDQQGTTRFIEKFASYFTQHGSNVYQTFLT